MSDLEAHSDPLKSSTKQVSLTTPDGAPADDQRPGFWCCYGRMWRYTFTLSARTRRREFVLATLCHLLVLLIPCLLFGVLAIITPKGSGDLRGLNQLAYVIFGGFVLTGMALVSFIPYMSMLIRRLQDSFNTKLFNSKNYQFIMVCLFYIPILVIIFSCIFEKKVLSFISLTFFCIILVVSLIIGIFKPSGDNPLKKFI